MTNLRALFFRLLLGFLSVVSTGWVARPAEAQISGPYRVAILIDEFVDGAQRAESDVEAATLDALASKPNVILVDPEQAQKVRKATLGRSLLAVDVEDLVTSLDADYLVVGEVRFEQNSTEGTGFDVQSFTARGRTKVIAVDSAQILAAPRPKANKFHPLSREAAISRAAEACASDLAARIVKAIENRPAAQVAMLLVEMGGPLDPQAIQGTVDCLSNETGSTARLVTQQEAALQIQISGGRTTTELTRKFGPEGLCGLVVVASSRHAIRARYRPDVRVPVVAGRFTLKGEVRPRDRWLAEETPRMLLTELSDLPYIELPADASVAPRLPKKRRGALGLGGSVVRQEGQLRIAARVVALSTGKTILAEKASCPDNAFGACMAEIGAAVSGRLLSQVMANRSLIPVGKSIRRVENREVLALSTPSVPSLYPARLSTYDQQPAGTIEIRNTSKSPVTDLAVFATLEGLSKEKPVALESQTIDAKRKVPVPFRLALAPEKLRDHAQTRAHTLSLRVEYRIGEFKYEQRRSLPMMVHGRNTLDWSEPKSVGSFVTHEQSDIEGIVESIRKGLPEKQRNDPMGLPVALFDAMNSLEYAPDKVNAFNPDGLDDVQYPVETLVRGAGDCDDLAVLYAAMLESVGRPAMLILTPGHVFVGIGTNVAPGNRTSLSLDEHALMVREGQTWLPIETTQTGASFVEAWKSARNELRETASAGTTNEVVIVRNAWRAFPPSDLTPVGLKPEVRVPGPDAVQAQLQQMADARKQQMEAIVAKLEQSDDPGDLNRLGVLLAHAARYDEAASAFSRSISTRETAPALNNLGNLDLVTNDAKAALGQYEKALVKDDGLVEIHLNALLAAHLLAVEDPKYADKRRELMLRALEVDVDSVMAFQARIPSGEITGADKGQTAGLSGLSKLLQAELRRRELPMQRTTASAYGNTRLYDHVHWIE